MVTLRRSLLLPFDVAAETRNLLFVNLPPRKNSIDGDPQILARYRDVVTGPTGIELATIDELSLAVEKEKVGRTGGCIGTRHILRLVVAIREAESKPLSLLFQVFRSIVRVCGSIIGRNSNNPNGFRGIVSAKLCYRALDVLYVGTMPANKHHQEGFLAAVIGQPHGISGNNTGQFKVGSQSPECKHRGFGAGHNSDFSGSVVR
jgi:hypothetical protein